MAFNLVEAKIVDSGSDDEEVGQLTRNGNKAAPASSSGAGGGAKAQPALRDPRGSGNLGKTLTLLRFNYKPQNADAHKAANPIAQLVPCGVSVKAREYIAAGFFAGAIDLCKHEDDIVGWAVALIMLGNPKKGIEILEAYIQSSCVNVFKHQKGIKSESMDPATLPLPTPNEVETVIHQVCSVASMQELHQWYLTGVMLHHDYEPPLDKVWVRHFFSLFLPQDGGEKRQRQGGAAGAAGQRRKKQQSGGGGGGGAGADAKQKQGQSEGPKVIVPRTKVLTAEDVERMMIEQATEAEIVVVTAYVSFALCRYKSAMEACRIALEKLDDRDICIRVIRAHCALQLGIRSIANEDITFLMRTSILIVRAVGNALATYAIPMPSAINAIKPDKFTTSEQEFVYAVGEWCHGLMLLQLGQFSAAQKVASAAAPLAPPNSRVQLWLCDIACIASILLTDETMIPNLILSPIRQLHLTLVGAFGGGFDKSGIGTVNETIGDLLSVKFLSIYCDARQAMVLHTLRARSLYSFGKLEEAWEEICAAVEAADELLGSPEFAMCECAPHRVLQYGIKFGLDLLERIIEEGGDDEPDPRDVAAVKKRQEDDAKGDAIIAMCKAWGQRLRSLAPRLVGGYCSVVSVMIAAHDANSVERAVTLTELFPHSVTALNLLSLALFQKHLIPDATSQAQRVLDQFPHVPETRKNFRDITGEDGLYTFLYRGVLPITYTDGEKSRLGARTVVIFALLLLHFIVLLGTVALNLDSLIPYPSAMDPAVSAAHLPNVYGLYAAAAFLVYTIVATVAPRSLLTVAFQELNIRNTRLNRFLFASRGLVAVNIYNAIIVYLWGSAFGLWWVWGLVVVVGLLLSFIPFTTRVFFLRSVDEPQTPVPFWFAIMLVDFITFIVLIIPHTVAVAVEPVMFTLYVLFIAKAKTIDNLGVVERIVQSKSATPVLASRQWDVSTGSRYIYVLLLRVLFWETHSKRDTVYALKKQQQADDLRIFPTIAMADPIPTEPREPPAALVAAQQQVLQEQHNQSAKAGGKQIRNLHLTGLTAAEVRAQVGDAAGAAAGATGAASRTESVRRRSLVDTILAATGDGSGGSGAAAADSGDSGPLGGAANTTSGGMPLAGAAHGGTMRGGTIGRSESFKRETARQQQETTKAAARRARLDLFFQENTAADGDAGKGTAADMFSMGAVHRSQSFRATSHTARSSTVGSARIEGALDVNSDDDDLLKSDDSWDLRSPDDDEEGGAGGGGSGHASQGVSRGDSFKRDPLSSSAGRNSSLTGEEMQKDIDAALSHIGSMKDLRASLRRTNSMQHGAGPRRRSSVSGSRNPSRVGSPSAGSSRPSASVAANAGGSAAASPLSRQSSGSSLRRENSLGGASSSNGASPNPLPPTGGRERRATLQPAEVVESADDKGNMANIMKSLIVGGSKPTGTFNAGAFATPAAALRGPQPPSPTIFAPDAESTGVFEATTSNTWNEANTAAMAIQAAAGGMGVGMTKRTSLVSFVSPDEKNFSKQNQNPAKVAADVERAAPPPPAAAAAAKVPAPPAAPRPVAMGRVPSAASDSGSSVAHSASSTNPSPHPPASPPPERPSKHASLTAAAAATGPTPSASFYSPTGAVSSHSSSSSMAAFTTMVTGPQGATAMATSGAGGGGAKQPPARPRSGAPQPAKGTPLTLADSADDELLTQSDSDSDDDDGAAKRRGGSSSTSSRSRSRSKSGSPMARKPTTTNASQYGLSSTTSAASVATAGGAPMLQRKASGANLSHRELGEHASTHNLQPKLPPSMQRAAHKVVAEAAAASALSQLPRRPESSNDGNSSVASARSASLTGANDPRAPPIYTAAAANASNISAGVGSSSSASSAVLGVNNNNNSAAPINTSGALRRSDSMPQTMREMIKRAEDNRTPGALPKATNGNIKLRRILDELRQTRTSIKASADEMSGGGDFSRIEFLRNTLQSAKLKAVAEIEKVGERIAVESTDTKTAVVTLIEELVKETDRHVGNSALVSVLTRNIVTMDFATLVIANNWLNKVVADGSPGFLSAFLAIPEIATNLTLSMAKELVTGCIRHKQKRAPLMLVLVRSSINCPVFSSEREKLEPLWQEAFEILASDATFQSDEDVTGRFEAIDMLMLHPCIQLDYTREARDKQTVFSRAAREGQLKMVQMLLNRKKIVDINRVQSDNTTALMQAAARNHVQVVQFLCKLDGIAPSFEHVLPGKGSVIEIAISMKRDPLIINALRERANQLGISHKGAAVAAAPADTPAFLLSPEQLREREDRDKQAIDATNAIKILLATSAPLHDSLAQLESIAAPTGEELGKIRHLRESIELSKQAMVTKMARLGERLAIKKPEIMDGLIRMLARCVHETDSRGGNMELFAAIHKQIVGLDLAQVAVREGWLVAAAANGSVKYMTFFTELPSMPVHIQPTTTRDCLIAARNNKIERIAVATNIIDHDVIHNLRDAQALLQPLWQKLFEDVAANQRANPQERRNGRMDLLKKIIRHPHIRIDFCEENFADHQTIFSRAAAEGDGDLVALILRSKCCADVSRVQSDGTTALIQAIRGGHTAVIEEMLPFSTKFGGDLNVNVVTPLGTALDVLISFGNRPELMVLRPKFVDAGALSSGAQLQSGAPQYGRRSPSGGGGGGGGPGPRPRNY